MIDESASPDYHLSAMATANQKRLILILLCLSAVSFLPFIPHHVRIGCGFLQAFYLPGLVFLLFFWDRQAPALDWIFIPPLISPIVLSLLIVCPYALTRSLGTSIVASVLILYCLLLAAVLRRGAPPAPGSREDLPLTVTSIPLLFCGLIGVFFLLNPYLVMRSDTLVHAPIVNEILDRGIPPMEPRFPDIPLRYMWFYHLFVAALVKLSTLSIFQAFGLFNVMSAFSFPYLIARLTARFSRRYSHIFLTPVFAIAGLASASWILWPVVLLKGLTGEVRGHEEVARILGQIEWNRSEIIFSLAPFGTLLVNNLDKFLTITAFNYATNLFLLCFLLVVSRDFQRRTPVAAAFDLAFIMVGTLLMHFVTGAVVIVAALGSGIVLPMGRRLGKWDRAPRFLTLVTPAVALLVGIICLPYFRLLTGGGSGQMVLGNYLHLGIMNVLTVLAPFIGLFFIIRPLLKWFFRTDSIETKVLFAWLLVLFTVNVFAKLPNANESKFAAFFLTLLVVPASIVLVDRIAALRGLRRSFTLVWVSVLFLVPAVLTARGFLLETPKTDAQRSVFMPDRDQTRLYDWIRANTADNATIMELNTFNYTPLYAHRHTFLLSPRSHEFFGYSGAKIDRYITIHQDIFSPEPVSESTFDYLRSLGLDIYVVLWAEDLRERPYLGEKFTSLEPPLKMVYENPAGKVYRLNGGTVP